MSSKRKILLFFGLLFNFALCEKNKISVVNGGYKDVIIGIADNIVIPDEEIFIEQLKGLFLRTSEKLNEATRNAVYFDEITVSVPSNWSLGTETTRFSATTFENSNIRIVNADDSPLSDAPWTSHSGFCGIQGDYISMTKEFIEGDDQFVQQFGSKEKALIHEWAHFRWGVFEEYGFPGDSRFPYFYFPPEKIEQVAVYSANADLAGIYRKIDGTTCAANDAGIYADDCRFFPNKDNATSVSLMSFHYLPGALQFDDLAYHRKSVPSKQNHLCNYQSIWETMMKNNEDFRNTVTVAKPTTFKIVKRLSSPVIFTIFDVGLTNYPNIDIEIIKSHLLSASESFVGRHFGFATYSGAQAIKFDIRLPINYLEDLNEVERALSPVTQSDDVSSTFSYPIDRAIRTIAEYGAPAGAILYVIGYSGIDYRNAFLEPHVLSLALESRIKVIGQESALLTSGIGNQLRRIGNMTDGIFFQFSGVFSKDELDSNFNWVQTILDKPINLGGKTLVSEAVADAQEHTLPFTVDVLNIWNDRLHIFVAGSRFGSGNIGSCSFKVTKPASWEVNSELQSNWGGEYSENQFLTVSQFAKSGIYILKTTCATPSNFWVDIILQTNNRGYPNFEPALDDLIRIKLLPSATSTENVSSPLRIFTKPMNGQYNVGNLKVKAHIRDVFSIPLRSSQHFTIDLFDDGFGDPDTFQDGIYSGMLIPPSCFAGSCSLSGGTYSIGIEIESDESSFLTTGGQMSIAADQSQICCGSSFPTKSLVLPSGYRRYFPDLWTFTMSSFVTEFKPPKITISHLLVEVTVHSGLLITMKWISPRGSATKGSVPVSRYEIHYSSNIDFLLDGHFTVVNEYIYCNPVTPGYIQTCQFIVSEFTEVTAFFRVAAVAGGEMGDFSPIVWSQPLREPSTETTPKTTTRGYTNTIFEYTTLDANNITQSPCPDVTCEPWFLPVVIVVPTTSVIAIVIIIYFYCFKKAKKPSIFFENMSLSSASQRNGFSDRPISNRLPLQRPKRKTASSGVSIIPESSNKSRPIRFF